MFVYVCKTYDQLEVYDQFNLFAPNINKYIWLNDYEAQHKAVIIFPIVCTILSARVRACIDEIGIKFIDQMNLMSSLVFECGYYYA